MLAITLKYRDTNYTSETIKLCYDSVLNTSTKYYQNRSLNQLIVSIFSFGLLLVVIQIWNLRQIGKQELERIRLDQRQVEDGVI